MTSHAVETRFKEDWALASQEINRRPGKACHIQVVFDQAGPTEDQNFLLQFVDEAIIYKAVW
jgi:hypothetical protein